MKIQLLTPEQASLKWHILLPILKRALDHGHQETDNVVYLSRVLQLQAQLWEITNDNNETQGVVLTQFLSYSNYQTLHLIALAGDNLDSWIHLYDHIEGFAKQNKAKAIESWGRKGWVKYLPKVLPGFTESYVIMRKEL
jgi:hypothetical protein